MDNGELRMDRIGCAARTIAVCRIVLTGRENVEHLNRSRNVNKRAEGKMARKTLVGLTALLFCMAFLTEYAAARPTPVLGARPENRLEAGFNHSFVIEEDGT